MLKGTKVWELISEINNWLLVACLVNSTVISRPFNFIQNTTVAAK